VLSIVPVGKRDEASKPNASTIVTQTSTGSAGSRAEDK
jgi:hypothetical protein